MNKQPKKADWKTLVTLARKYDRGGNPLPGPAVQTTYSYSDETYYFSHTPGIVVEGAFRPLRYLHDRHIETYMLLLMDAMMAVSAARKLGMKDVESDIGLFRMAMRDAQNANRTLEQVERAARIINVASQSLTNSGPRKSKPKPVKASSLRASLGDMMRAKGSS